MLLSTSFPGVSLDLVDSALQESYNYILQATDWTGLKAHAMIQTVAAYQSPTNPPSPPSESVSLTVGSNAVTGTGTAWTSARVGQMFFRAGDTVVYTVAGVTSATALTLDRGYEGTGTEASGTVFNQASYTFMVDIYTLPADAASPVTIINPVNGKPMQEMSKNEFDYSRGSRATVGDPWVFCVYDDSPESAPPVLHRIQFYYPPLRSRGYDVQYLRNANVFNGQNTGASPLPFVFDAAILDGARARLFLDPIGNVQKATAFAASAESQLNKMLMNEHAQTRPDSAFHMAARYTRHRLNRVDRTWGRNWGKGQGGPV